MGKCEVAERCIQIGRSEAYSAAYAKGYEEGYELTIKEFVTRILESGKTPEEIADFCHLDLEKVKEIQKKIIKEKDT